MHEQKAALIQEAVTFPAVFVKLDWKQNLQFPRDLGQLLQDMHLQGCDLGLQSLQGVHYPSQKRQALTEVNLAAEPSLQSLSLFSCSNCQDHYWNVGSWT